MIRRGRRDGIVKRLGEMREGLREMIEKWSRERVEIERNEKETKDI